jgi:DNA-binding XRE family transcriptional regulator
MPRPTDPSSERQVRERAKRMRGPWTEQVLRNLAGAVLQATRWRAWESAGGEPGPDDTPASWPRLPDTPGERVELGITKLDMSTPEGWDAARELLEHPGHWDAGERLALQERVAQELAQTLEHSHQLGPSFYSRHSLRAGEMLLQRTLPVTVLAGPYQSLWRKPEHPLGLPPADHPTAQGLVGHEETAALEQVAWEAARELYRSLGNPQPDEHGRRGLERPEELRRWGERLGLVEPDGTVAVGPLGDEDAHRVATGLPWSKAQATLLSPRIQEQGEGLPPGHLHRSRTAMSPTRGGHETLVSVAEHSSALEANPQAWAHLQKAQQLLETHGPEMARLSLYLSMHVCGRPDPTAPFLVQGEDLLEDFGLVSTSGGRGRTAVLERSTRLKHQAELARALDLVTVQAKDYLGPADKNGRRPFRRFTGRLWQVESLELGTESQLTLGAEVAQDPEEVVTTLRLLVRPGSWVQMYPTQAQEPGAQLWYGHVATAVLRLSHQRNQLAACLGLYLSTALVEQKARLSEGRREFLVGSLLERVTVARELERAQAPGSSGREAGRLLRDKWVAALDVLHRTVGFRFTFCRDTYPAWAIPESLLGDREPWEGPAPHGALEQLLKGHLTVGWPVPVLEAATSSKAAASSEALAAQVRNPKALASGKAPGGKPSGTLLKEARKAAGLNQRDAADLLGLGKSTYNRMETCQRPLPRTELNRYLEQLVEHRRRERWAGGRP